MNDQELRAVVFDGLTNAMKNGYREYLSVFSVEEIAGDIIAYDAEIGALWDRTDALEKRLIPLIRQWLQLDQSLQALTQKT